MTYLETYKEFMVKVESNLPIDGLEVGRLIAVMAQYFAEAVQLAVTSERDYNNKLVEFEKQVDENGKALSSAKAEAFSKATDEWSLYSKTKGDVNSLETLINALKSLQKGTMNEYSHFGDS